MVSDIVVDDAIPLSEALATLVEGESRAACAARGSFALALPGGSVATTFFPRLARAALDWSRTDVFWVDERAVPVTDPESNYGAAHALLLSPAGVPDARVHRMDAEGPDLEATARACEDELRRVLGPERRLDVALIGVGPDGHVGSLFPGHALLSEETRRVAAIIDAPKPPPRRLTLTLPMLSATRHVVVAALGEGKAERIRESLEDATSALPLARLVRRAARVTVFLDPAAAARLKS
jgi:6-phosphogluconolactonase